jgi:drug/metabolite transporter (DMT)-like permease
MQHTMGRREWGLLLLLSILWGGSFFFSKVALAELAPFSVVLGRVAIAALALHVIVRLSGQRMPSIIPDRIKGSTKKVNPVDPVHFGTSDLSLWRRFIVMGAINNLIPFSLIFYGQTQIASGLASILNATTPLWTVLLANWLTSDERLTPLRLSGVLIGLAGVIVLIGPDLLGGLGLNVIAQLAVVGAAISYACAGIFGKGFKGVPPLVTATGQLTATSIMMLPIALLVDQPWLRPLPGLNIWAALLGLALLSTALAYQIYFQLLARAGATNLLLVTFLIPVSALLLGFSFLEERLSADDFLGMACIGLGLAVIDGRLPHWLWRRTTEGAECNGSHGSTEGAEGAESAETATRGDDGAMTGR